MSEIQTHCPKCGTSYNEQPNMARNENGPEGTAEFIGPARRVWTWTKNNDGKDPRCMTGFHTYNAFRVGFKEWEADAIDAPTRMAAGSTKGTSGDWEAWDADRNVFPRTFNRD